jgi:NAD+ synthase (glutamine-hydrolysing)
VAFPELALTGYPPEDLVLKPVFVRDTVKMLASLATSVGDITAIVGFVDSDGTDVYNAAAILQCGQIVGRHHKFYLPNYSVFDEQRYFRAGREWSVYTVRGVKIGVTICEDIWYPVGPGTLQAMAGAEVIININASPYHSGKYEQRRSMVATRALDELSYVCYLNMVGGQDELVFEGASMICDQGGRIVARGKFFEEDFIVADLDADAVFSARLHDTRRRQSLNAFPGGSLDRHLGQVLDTPLTAPTPPRKRAELPLFDPPVPDRLEEIFLALVLGTRDYVHKAGYTSVVIGLSGGIDSSLTAAIAVDAFGPENVTGVSMPSRYSSEGSERDAAALAQNLYIKRMIIPIEEPFAAYLKVLSCAFEETTEDITEENLQSRARGNILMALANKFHRLTLTTGNKSELAVGYSTLYGDLAGGFAVIKDVYKTTVFELAAHCNVRAGREIIPQAVIEKEPSAELRPEQKDIDSLPPYNILDGILKLYLEDDRSSDDIVSLGYEPVTVGKVINMVEASEYKRRQSPPGAKISPRAFGKDRRPPITNKYRDIPSTQEQ